MAVLPISLYPDACLLEKAHDVTEFDAELEQLVHDMIETMDDAPGIGLAAPQVGVSKRLFVVDVSEERNARRVFINPEILERSGTTQYEEGCLSIPFVYGEVTRAEKVLVKAYDVKGDEFMLEADGLLAICIQHEYDHLEGILFIDHLTRLKRERLLAQMRKKLAEHRVAHS